MGKTVLSMLTLAAVMAAGPIAAASEDSSPVGKKIENFSAQDFRGKEVSLADFADSKQVVVAFLGTQCPLAKLYAPRLAELAAEFEKQGVAFIGVDSNRQDSITEFAHYARIHEIEFPLLKDAGNVIADQFGAVRTPEVFLLDGNRIVRYWGRIDDQYGFGEGFVGYQREQPVQRDLANAIAEVAAGKPVTNPVMDSQGCHIGRIKEPVANSEITYSKHIAKIFNDNCVFCHREGQIGPFTLTSYEDAVGWADMIREVTNERRMPPWHADPAIGHFANDARLSDEELAQINTWVENGAPEGDPNDVPPVPTFAEGWQIPKPDVVIKMADEPYMVPATGTVEYQRFVVDPGFTEDKWVQAMECVPGNPAVVHHIIVYLVPPGVTPSGQAGRLRSNWLGAFAPGLRPQVLDEDLGRYIQAGSKLLFEMHYTPNGTAPNRSQLCGLQMGRSQDREERSRRAERRQLHVQDSARRSELRGRVRIRLPQGLDPAHGFAAHARSWQRFPLRLDLSGRQARDLAVGTAIRLWLADDVRVGRAEAGAARQKLYCVAPLRQLRG